MMELSQMFKDLRDALDITQGDLAEKLDCSSQFICDVEKGRRTPSVAFIDRLCDWLERGPKGRREWHLAGARANGWKI